VHDERAERLSGKEVGVMIILGHIVLVDLNCGSWKIGSLINIL